MPKDLLCFLPNRGFVLKDTVCWPLPQDSKAWIGLSWGLYLDDKWYIVDLCHWSAIWFLGVCRVYSNGLPDPGKQTSQPLSRQHWSFCTLSVCSWILVSIMSIFTLVFSLNAGSLWWRSSNTFEEFLRAGLTGHSDPRPFWKIACAIKWFYPKYVSGSVQVLIQVDKSV